MKSLVLTAIAMTMSASALAVSSGEQVWNASLTNTQEVCGIDYPTPGSPVEGSILTAGESGTDGDKAITFNLRTNTAKVAWKITEAKLVENTGRFSFPDDLMQISNQDETSIYVNNSQYAWNQAGQEHDIGSDKATHSKHCLLYTSPSPRD